MWILILLYMWIQKKKGDDYMSPRTGRPTNDPKKLSTRIRMSDEDIKMLEYCCEVTGRTKADIIRDGIREVYNKIKNSN